MMVQINTLTRGRQRKKVAPPRPRERAESRDQAMTFPPRRRTVRRWTRHRTAPDAEMMPMSALQESLRPDACQWSKVIRGAGWARWKPGMKRFLGEPPCPPWLT